MAEEASNATARQVTWATFAASPRYEGTVISKLPYDSWIQVSAKILSRELELHSQQVLGQLPPVALLGLIRSSKFFEEVLSSPSFRGFWVDVLDRADAPDSGELSWHTGVKFTPIRMLSLIHEPDGPCDSCERTEGCEVDFTWGLRLCPACLEDM